MGWRYLGSLFGTAVLGLLVVRLAFLDLSFLRISSLGIRMLTRGVPKIVLYWLILSYFFLCEF